VESPDNPAMGRDAGGGIKISDSLEKVLTGGDLVVDFTQASATLPNLEVSAKLRKGAVVGTTGHSPDQLHAIQKITREIPLVMAPNMSVMVNVLWQLISKAAEAIGERSRVTISETHHIHKRDKPSGTALEIQNLLRLKNANIVKLESKREGEVVGDHTVIFDTPEESIELTHRAKSRDTFAVGALMAAKWVVGRPAGLYSMKDVLGL
jgi:4-hydroxy-tetrahydrodipicolinate reductase